MIIINFKKLTEGAIIPTQAHPTDAGIDFYSNEDGVVYPHESYVFSTGVTWEPNFKDWSESNFKWNIYMQVQSRSGLAFKHGIEVTNAGVIDQDFRGEIKIKLYNTSDKPYMVQKGDRIAQGVVKIVPKVYIKEVVKITEETERGENGYGSTGR